MTKSDRVFFIHTPKTAGTSVTQVIDQHFKVDDIFPTQELTPVRGSLDITTISTPRRLEDYMLFRGHFPWPVFEQVTKIVGPMRSFSFLRDPIARIQSAYLHLRRAPAEWTGVGAGASVAAKRQDFTSFIRGGYVGKNFSQVATFLDHPETPADEAIEIAVERLNGLDMFGLAEALEVSLLLLNRALRLPITGETPIRNQSPVRPRSLSSQDLALLLEMTELDRAFYRRAQDIFWDRVGSLTSSRYQSQPLKLPSTITMTDPIIGLNWHTREGGPAAGHHLVWRWTGPGCHSRIDLQLEQETGLRIEVAVLNAVSHDVHETLSFSVNGRILPHDQRQNKGEGIIYGINVTEAIVRSRAKQLRLGIHVGHTRTFHEIDSSIDDHRKLGIAVTRIDLIPADH